MLRDAEAILQAARHLADALQGSELYRAYRQDWQRVEAEPATALQVRLFKQTEAEMAAGRAFGQPVSFEEEKAASHRSAELTANPVVASFFASERAFMVVYGQILDILDAACEVELF